MQWNCVNKGNVRNFKGKRQHTRARPNQSFVERKNSYSGEYWEDRERWTAAKKATIGDDLTKAILESDVKNK